MTLIDPSSDISVAFQTPLFTIGSTETTVARLLVVVAIILATAGFARLARRATTRYFGQRGIETDLEMKTAARVIEIVVWVVGFEIAFPQLDVHFDRES